MAGLAVIGIRRVGAQWSITAAGSGHGACPVCGLPSSSRHSSYFRRLQDLPLQGAAVTVDVKVARLRCRNQRCARQIFAERLPGVAATLARRTHRVQEIVRLLGQNAGGRPAERILVRLGMPISDDAVRRGAGSISVQGIGPRSGQAAETTVQTGLQAWPLEACYEIVSQQPFLWAPAMA
jgi:hypothetical protein